jgi:hypothetical protein
MQQIAQCLCWCGRDMNSRQRRRARRYWKYTIEMDYHNDDKDPWEARTWLEDSMGKIGRRWGQQTNNNPWVFFFHDGRDAAFFSMKWS